MSRWVSVVERLPPAFERVWVMTDTGRQATGYVKSDASWHINCPTVAATGAEVLRWRDDRAG